MTDDYMTCARFTIDNGNLNGVHNSVFKRKVVKDS